LIALAAGFESAKIALAWLVGQWLAWLCARYNMPHTFQGSAQRVATFAFMPYYQRKKPLDGGVN
jgi:hypothetical protein